MFMPNFVLAHVYETVSTNGYAHLDNMAVFLEKVKAIFTHA